MDRKGLLVGNWKMMLSHKAEVEVAKALKKLVKKNNFPDVGLVFCPSYVSLQTVAEEFLSLDGIGVGVQQVHVEEKGPFTGMVSIGQVTPYAKWSIVGHSEQRAATGLTDRDVSETAMNLIRHGITPVVCIGETAEEKDADKTVERVTEQVNQLIEVMTRPSLPHLVIAYEPIWAISSNDPVDPPSSNDVSAMALLIRKLLTARFGESDVSRVRVLYGGSVSPHNIANFVQEPGVDGALVGSASVHPMKFIEMAEIVQKEVAE